MTITSEITKLNTNLEAAYTAVDGKGGTLPQAQNFDNLAAAISSIPSGGGGVTLTRFKDDSNNEIGTYYMDFEDGNGNTYKVVILDAQYRLASSQWCSRTVAITNMPLYSNSVSTWWYNAQETATANTQLILDYCSANSYTSTSCSHCRSKSFTINGTTYYGQLPNVRELFEMWCHRADIESMDTSASSNTSLNFSSARAIWSSSQYSSSNGWYLSSGGHVTTAGKASNYFACPVLEIPNS